ncbi:unnamed protein product [Meloidogyne enterolobii]|uniref:Uncharacterized protein n=1 Tax=Meloidogyne enterolobii TaxID=390850 RepID=A0ACB1B196_MELEN
MATDVDNNILLLKPFTPKLIEPQTENLHSCAICESTALYKCPKCLIRTCSAKCSKTHKEKNNICLSLLHFLVEDTSLNTQNLNDNQKPKLSYNDQSLLKSAQFRRIWLLPSNDSKDFGSSRIEQFSDTIFWKCTVKFAYRAPVEETEEMNESSIKNEESFQEDETFDDQASSSVITHLAKPLVDYEVEDGEELKISDNIVDVKEEKIEKEEGEIETEVKTEEKQFTDNEGNEQHDDEKMIEDINSYQEPLPPLKWLSYTVQNIPESIRVSTLLRQFLRPKPYGTVISKSELDMDFLQQFTTASKSIIDPANDLHKECVRDQLTVYSEVALPLGKEEDEVTSENDCQIEAELRYYPVNPQQTILENLRNRYVVGHPSFVVLLRRENEFGEFEFPMVGEVEQALLNAERERTVVVKDRPRWQNRNRNSEGGRGFRNGGQFQHNSRQHRHGGKKGGGRQRMSEHNEHSGPPNGQWQQQCSYGPIYNTPPFNQYHFHPYMPATFMPQMAQPRGQWSDQRGFSQ